MLRKFQKNVHLQKVYVLKVVFENFKKYSQSFRNVCFFMKFSPMFLKISLFSNNLQFPIYFYNVGKLKIAQKNGVQKTVGNYDHWNDVPSKCASPRTNAFVCHPATRCNNREPLYGANSVIQHTRRAEVCDWAGPLVGTKAYSVRSASKNTNKSSAFKRYRTHNLPHVFLSKNLQF